MHLEWLIRGTGAAKPEVTLCFSVPGKPMPQARPRAFVRGAHARVFSPQAGTSKADLAKAFLEISRHEPWKPWEGPVSMQIEYRFLMPKSGWPGKDHLGRPDLDNLDKLVMDALNGVAFRDDSQIVAKFSSKSYDDTEWTIVRLDFFEPTLKRKRLKKNSCGTELLGVCSGGEAAANHRTRTAEVQTND